MSDRYCDHEFNRCAKCGVHVDVLRSAGLQTERSIEPCEPCERCTQPDRLIPITIGPGLAGFRAQTFRYCFGCADQLVGQLLSKLAPDALRRRWDDVDRFAAGLFIGIGSPDDAKR